MQAKEKYAYLLGTLSKSEFFQNFQMQPMLPRIFVGDTGPVDR